MNLRLILLLMAALPILFVTSCGTDEPDPDTGDEFLPVLDENFEFTVTGNDVVFTTEINGNVWVTANDVDYPFVDKTVTVNLPNQGTYSFTCSSLGSGEVLTSAAFDVVIEQDDLGFLNEGFWKHLSGGANETKTWKMDMNADGKCVYFAGPVFYSGADGNPYWSWDITEEVSPENPYDLDGTSMTSIFNWSPDYAGNTWLMAARDYGTITFDATNGTVSTSIFGETANGSFTFDDETMKLNLTGVHMPIDTARLNEGQFIDENLAALRIFSLSDSAMQVGIKRSFEGFNEDGSNKVSEWTMIYNFIVADYTYAPEEFTYTEPIKSSFTATDLEGTWKYAAAPFDWIGWPGVGSKGTVKTAVVLNNWADAASVVATGWAATQEALDAVADDEFVFNSDGSCTLNGVANTYTVSDGVITLGTALTTEVAIGWFTLAGTTLNVQDVEGAITGGIWVGFQNPGKFESQAVHLIKQ